LHIALVEKLFAASYQTAIYAFDNGQLWSHGYGEPVANERPVAGGSRPAFKVWGPFHADAVPFTSINNMPESQKVLANYGVLFTDDGNTIWVELGPRFGPDEAPHLGCQTQLGRDIVFGFNEKPSDSQGTSGKFLQCF
jgi:hypothetical protein